MKIGILQCGHVHPDVLAAHGSFGDMFTTLLAGYGFEFTFYDVVDMHFPAHVQEMDGWLLTGSAHGAYEDHPFIPPLEDLIREAYANEVPLVGICFGHQIIAQALGGKVEKFKGGWSIGKQDYQTPTGEFFTLNAWHQDQVVVRPEGAEVSMHNDFCKNAGLVYGNRAMTVQAHPEFSDPLMRAYLLSREDSEAYPQDMIDKARNAPFGHVDSHALAEQFAAFFANARLQQIAS